MFTPAMEQTTTTSWVAMQLTLTSTMGQTASNSNWKRFLIQHYHIVCSIAHASASDWAVGWPDTSGESRNSSYRFVGRASTLKKARKFTRFSNKQVAKQGM